MLLSTYKNFYSDDLELSKYGPIIDDDQREYESVLNKLCGKGTQLKQECNTDAYLGLHRDKDGWVFREWAPNATAVYIVGEMNSWRRIPEYECSKNEKGVWELKVAENKVHHGMLYRLSVKWKDGEGERLPAYAHRVVQDEYTKQFSAEVWCPNVEYNWINSNPKTQEAPLIYEVHIGMSSEYKRVTTFREFQYYVLPRIVEAGYNTIQIMGVQEHPYYGSFGYHVSNFYAVSSRFGTPDDFKALVDEIHGYGLRVIMDIVHSHAVKNEEEGLSMIAGDRSQYFKAGEEGYHPLWDSYCFDYSKDEVLKFLLSNVRFWMEEYRIDGFRFDGVTSMLYHDHGINRDFLNYGDYYDLNRDRNAIVYLKLANKLIHEVNPVAISIAEEVSGMPGIAVSVENEGMGFDYRLFMASADYWIKLLKETKDDDWQMGELYYRLTNKRTEEKVINYAECHDQSLVGDQALFFRMAGPEIYSGMGSGEQSLVIDRAMALHKMIRLVTIGTSCGGYLAFMGNEWGHPEWIDFPREGNEWSYDYACRKWSLVDDKSLKFHFLQDFDKVMIHSVREEHLLSKPLELIIEDNSKQLLGFMRGDFFFIFNFSPTHSITDSNIPVNPGKYTLLLDTDDKRFGGFGRQEHALEHFSYYDERTQTHRLNLYIPSRTGMLFIKS
ncbi:MAG: alpha-amylase family glycosyl hydrolase [Marinifilaceae bacterium]